MRLLVICSFNIEQLDFFGELFIYVLV
jgi:hypothetical protein